MKRNDIEDAQDAIVFVALFAALVIMLSFIINSLANLG